MLTYAQQMELDAKLDAIDDRMLKLKYSRSASAAYRDTVWKERRNQEAENANVRLQNMPEIKGPAPRADGLSHVEAFVTGKK